MNIALGYEGEGRKKALGVSYGTREEITARCAAEAKQRFRRQQVRPAEEAERPKKPRPAEEARRPARAAESEA